MNLKKESKILVIRFSSLGDILLTTPFLRVLKTKFPNSKIDYLIKTSFIDAIKLNPNLNSIFSWHNNNELKDLSIQLKATNYDLVVDLQNNFRSRDFVKKLRTTTLTYQKPNIKKFLLVHTKLNFLKERKSIPQRYAEVIPNLKLDDKGLELHIPKTISANLSNSKIIGFAPGAFHFTKRWPLEYYSALGKKLNDAGYLIAIFGGKSDIEICSELQRRIPNSIDLSNNNLLFETAANMKECKVIVCNDSGLMHTGTAVGVPVVSIFGSTVQEFGFAPYGVDNLIIENHDLSCRPCTHVGKAVCKKNHFNCMNDLTPDLVYNRLKKFMGNL